MRRGPRRTERHGRVGIACAIFPKERPAPGPGFEVWKEPLLQCLGMPTCAGGVFREAERLKLAAISERVCPSWQLPRHRAKYHWKLSVDTPNKAVLEQMLGTRG